MDKIIINNLRKEYKDVVAVENLSLQINKGEIFALLGVNGAGKTTTIKMLIGLINPTSGNATIFGVDLKNKNEIKKMIGISPQENAIANNLTVQENIQLMCALYGEKNIAIKTQNIMRQLSLENYKNRKAKNLSGGYKRRLSIAMALVMDPDILFLDEPTLGLDVINRRDLWKLIAQLKGDKTIFLTSHYMEEVAFLADHLAIMKDGKLLEQGTLENILAKTQTKNLEDAFIKIVGGIENA